MFEESYKKNPTRPYVMDKESGLINEHIKRFKMQ